MTPQPLPVSLLRRDGGTQPRTGLDEDMIAQIAEALAGGELLPAVQVVHDGTDYWLWDGFHRCAGHDKAHITLIDCLIRPGTRRDAVLLSYSANKEHDSAGRRRSNADKQRSVEGMLRDAEWGIWNDSEIARHTGVSDKTVAKYRSHLRNSEDAPAYLRNSEDAPRRVQRNGTTYEMKTASIGRTPTGVIVNAGNRQALAEPCSAEDGAPYSAACSAQCATLTPALPPLYPETPQPFTWNRVEDAFDGVLAELGQAQSLYPNLDQTQAKLVIAEVLRARQSCRDWFQGKPVAPAKPARHKEVPEDVPIPESLDTPEFRELWQDWREHRIEKGRKSKAKLTRPCQKQAMRKMEGWGLERAIAALKHSIAAGWDGVFEEDKPRQEKGKVTETRQERLARIEAEMTEV